MRFAPSIDAGPAGPYDGAAMEGAAREQPPGASVPGKVVQFGPMLTTGQPEMAIQTDLRDLRGNPRFQASLHRFVRKQLRVSQAPPGGPS
jgi:hypothetical protein